MSFANFKQFALQSVGKAEKTQEEPEFLEMIKVMKETKAELTAIHDAAKKYHSEQQRAADLMEKFSGSLSKFTSTDSSARSNLLEAVPLMSKSATAETEWLNQFKVNVVDTVNSILEIQVKACEKAWKHVEEARLTYDAMSSKFKSTLENTKKSTQEDIDRAKQKADDAEQQYQKAKETCTEACRELQTHKDQFALSKISTLAQALGEASAAKCTNATQCLESLAK
jgi:myosin heavy subunit